MIGLFVFYAVIISFELKSGDPDEKKTNNAAEEKADVAAWKMNKIMFKGII